MNLGLIEIVKYNDERVSRSKVNIDKPILCFNSNILKITAKDTETVKDTEPSINLGYDGVLDNEENVLNYIPSKGTYSEFGKIQIIYVNNKNIKLINEDYKVSMNDKVQEFKDISEFIKIFNELSKQEFSSPVLLKVIHTISEDKKNLKTEIILILTNLS